MEQNHPPKGPAIVRRQRLRLTFPEALITQPVLSDLGREFDVVTNIRRADVRERTGWVILELSGESDRLEAARQHLENIGVRVDPVESYVE